MIENGFFFYRIWNSRYDRPSARTDLRARLAKMPCDFCAHYGKTADNHDNKKCTRLMMGWCKELKACTRENNCTRYDCSFGHYDHDGKPVWSKWQTKWRRLARHYNRTGDFLPEETEERRSGALGGGDGSAPAPAPAPVPAPAPAPMEGERKTEAKRKNDLGERLYPLIVERLKEAANDATVAALHKECAISAGKITGMLLEQYDFPTLETLISDEKDRTKAICEAIDLLVNKWNMTHNTNFDAKSVSASAIFEQKTAVAEPAPAPKMDPHAEIAQLKAMLETANHKIGFLEFQLNAELTGRIAAEHRATTAERQRDDALSVVKLLASTKP